MMIKNMILSSYYLMPLYLFIFSGFFYQNTNAVLNRQALFTPTTYGLQYHTGACLALRNGYVGDSLEAVATASIYNDYNRLGYALYRGINTLPNSSYIYFSEVPNDIDIVNGNVRTDPPRMVGFASASSNVSSDGYWGVCMPWYGEGLLRDAYLEFNTRWNTNLNTSQGGLRNMCWGLSGSSFVDNTNRKIILYNKEIFPSNSSTITIYNVTLTSSFGPIHDLVFTDTFAANYLSSALEQTAVMSATGYSYAYGYNYGTIKAVYNATAAKVFPILATDIPYSMAMSKYGDILAYGSHTTITNLGTSGRVVVYTYNATTGSYNSSAPVSLIYPYRYANSGQGFSIDMSYDGTVIATGMPYGFESAGAIALWRKYPSGVWIPSQIPYTKFTGAPVFVNDTRPLYVGWTVALQRLNPVRLYTGAPSKKPIHTGLLLFYDEIMNRVFPTSLPTLPAWQELFIPTTLPESSTSNSLSLHLGTNSGLYSLTVSKSSINGTANYRYLSTIFANDPVTSYNVINAPQAIGQLATPPTVVSGSDTSSIGCLSNDGLRFARIDLERVDGIKVLEIGVRTADGLPWVFLSQNQFTLSNNYTFFDIVCSSSLQFITVMNVRTVVNTNSLLSTYMAKNNSALTEWSNIYSVPLPADTVSTYINMPRQNAYLGISQNGRRLYVYNRNSNAIFTYITANGQYYSSTSLVSIIPLNSSTLVHSMTSEYFGYQLVVSVEVSGTISVYSYTVVGNGGHFTTTGTLVTPSSNTIPSISGGLALCKSGRTLFIGSRTAGGVLTPCAMTRADFKISLSWIYNGTAAMTPYGTANGTIIGRFDRNVITDDGTQASVRSAYTDSILTFKQMPGNTASSCTTLEPMPPTPISATGVGDVNGVLTCPSASELGFDYQMCGFASYFSPDGNTLALLGIRTDNLRAFAVIMIRTPPTTSTQLDSIWTFWKLIMIGPIVTNNMTDTLLNWKTPPNAVIRISNDRRIVVIGSGWKSSASSTQTEPVFVYWYNNVTAAYQNSQNITNPLQSYLPFNFGTSIELIRTGLQLSINVFTIIPNYGRVVVYRLPSTDTGIENQQFYQIQLVEAPTPGSGTFWAHQISSSAYGTALVVAHQTDFIDFYSSTINSGLYNFVNRVSIGSPREIVSLKMSGNGLTCFVNAKSSTTGFSFVFVLEYNTITGNWSTNTSAPLIYPPAPGLSAITGAIGTDDGGHLVAFPVWQPNITVPIADAIYSYGYMSNALLSNTTFNWYNTPGEILNIQHVNALNGRQYSQGQVRGNTYNVNAAGSVVAANVIYKVNSTRISGGVIVYYTGQFFQSPTPNPGNFPPAVIPPLQPPIVLPPVSPPLVVIPPVQAPLTPPFSPNGNQLIPLQTQIETDRNMAITALTFGIIGMVVVVVGSILGYVYLFKGSNTIKKSGNVANKPRRT